MPVPGEGGHALRVQIARMIMDFDAEYVAPASFAEAEAERQAAEAAAAAAREANKRSPHRRDGRLRGGVDGGGRPR